MDLSVYHWLLIAAFPIYTWLVSKRCPRLVASLVTGLAVFVVLILGLAAIVWPAPGVATPRACYSPRWAAPRWLSPASSGGTWWPRSRRSCQKPSR